METFAKLCEKVDIEIEAFKKHYEGLAPMAVYNDSYKINFYESFKNLLSSDYVADNEYNADVLAWLVEKGGPIGFLYDTYMRSDFEMSYDWDDMLEWVKGVYFEELRREDRATSLDDVIKGAAEQKSIQKDAKAVNEELER